MSREKGMMTLTARADRSPRHLRVEALARLRDRLFHEFTVEMDSVDAVRGTGGDDTVEASGRLVQFEVDWHVEPRDEGALTEVEAALVRMAVGTYGSCEDCARSIPLARLEASPHARYCPPCETARRDLLAASCRRRCDALASAPSDTG